ncbi:hypothetical protein IJ135_00730 [Candidatus Saccharibacteria bacterium]|nr:hypothetical protein [Candidatus Saccharibacteria bacterium]
MKNMLKKLAIVFTLMLASVSLAAPTPVFAAESSTSGKNCVPTAILGQDGCFEDNGGSGISHIIMLVIDIMSVGVGILGVIGISISGIQYLTAGGNEERTRKSKRRLFEIVIGLVAYGLIYALMSWIVPNFRDGSMDTIEEEKPAGSTSLVITTTEA